MSIRIIGGGRVVKLLYRYRFVPLVAIVVVAVMMMTWGKTQNSPVSTFVLAPVVVNDATIVAQGIELTWLSVSNSTTPIVGYIVERSRGGGDFQQIGRAIGQDVSVYLDSKGREGDLYRVVTEDNQTPAQRSAPSQQVIAAASKPGKNMIVALAGSGRGVLGASSANRQASPGEQTQQLQLLAGKKLDELTVELNTGKVSSAATIFTVVQDYYSQILALFPKLSAQEKQLLAQNCEHQTTQLDINLHLLPESDQMDGTLILATCHVIEEAAR